MRWRAVYLLGSLGVADAKRPLYAIARRVCSEARRSIGRRRAPEGQAMMFVVAEQNARRADAPSHDALSPEQLDRLSHALAQLDDRERLAIHLHYLEANPEQAAREALGLSRSGYYKTLTRARHKLAALLADQTANVS